MGTNTIPSAVDGTPIPSTDHNAIKEALGNDLVPRNTSGVPTAVQGNVGTATYPWLAFYFGLVASGLSIREDSGNIAFYVGGSKVFEFGSAGLLNNVVGYDNLVASNFQESSSSGTFSTASATFVDVTNLSVSITTTGRPIRLMLCSAGDPTASGIARNGFYAEYTSSAGHGELKVLRDSTILAIHDYDFVSGVVTRNSSLEFTEEPAAGTYTYKIQAAIPAGVGNFTFANMKLVVVEI